MADLFQTTKQNISLHIQNIFEEELDESSVVRYSLTTAADGKNYSPKYFNLDVNGFLKFNQQDILSNPGKVSMEVAKWLALEKYEQFNKGRLAIETAKTDDPFEKSPHGKTPRC